MTLITPLLLLAAQGAVLPPDTRPDWKSLGQPGSLLGSELVSGDFDGDGFDDLLAVSMTPGQPVLEVYSGSANGLANVSDLQLHIPELAGRTHLAFDTGDLNGDGFADLAVSYPGALVWTGGRVTTWEMGRAFVFQGSASGLTTIPVLEVEQAVDLPTRFGHTLAFVGDTDGNGCDDLAIGAPGAVSYADAQGITTVAAGAVYLFTGDPGMTSYGALRHESTASWSAHETVDPWSTFGHRIAGAGDLNGDGFDEILIASPFRGSPQVPAHGEIQMWHGSPTGLNFGNPGDANAPHWRVQGHGPYSMVGEGPFVAGMDLGTSPSAPAGVPDLVYVDQIFPRSESGFAPTVVAVPGISYGYLNFEHEVLKPQEHGAFFAADLTLLPDFQGDGLADVVVADGSAARDYSMEGAIHVFTGPLTFDRGQERRPMLRGYSGADDLGIGIQVTCGDYDGDGKSDVVTGYPNAELPGLDEDRGALSLHEGRGRGKLFVGRTELHAGEVLPLTFQADSTTSIGRVIVTTIGGQSLGLGLFLQHRLHADHAGVIHYPMPLPPGLATGTLGFELQWMDHRGLTNFSPTRTVQVLP